MKINRIILTDDSTKKLQLLKSKTGLTPNILCRFGLILSLQDNTIPDPILYKQDGQELLRHVLLGEIDNICIALFKQRAAQDNKDLSDEKSLVDYFRAHINRGAELIYNRSNSLISLF
ncbi:MAG: DNA sulfur modification protein DndE [Gudongella sp.]|jgi:DNA sulfur modification protein DndE|nr:DNA sulfur modification protein DndE [Gudongella sp.]